MLYRKSSRYFDARSSTARFAVIEYSIDCRKCHVCGGTGNGSSPVGNCRSGTSDTSNGVGLPIVSVSRPIMLWKYVVVRSPPLYQVEYEAPLRIVVPGFPSATIRLCIAEPTISICGGINGSKL